VECACEFGVSFFSLQGFAGLVLFSANVAALLSVSRRRFACLPTNGSRNDKLTVAVCYMNDMRIMREAYRAEISSSDYLLFEVNYFVMLTHRGKINSRLIDVHGIHKR